MARTGKKRNRVAVRDMKFKNDPMIRFYESTQDWLQEKGRPVVIAIAAVAGLVLIYTIGDYFFEYRESKAAGAFAEALKKYNAPVTDTASAGAKWQESAEAFERLANDYPGYYGSIGRYYAGASYLHVDREKGIQVLEQVASKNDQPTSDLARLAMAESAAANGEAERAIPIYEQLLNSSYVPKPVVQLGLGRSYEKKGDTEKAVEAYFEATRADRSSPAGMDAEKRLSALAPDRLKDLPPPDTSTARP